MNVNSERYQINYPTQKQLLESEGVLLIATTKKNSYMEAAITESLSDMITEVRPMDGACDRQRDIFHPEEINSS